jgi:ribosomal protein S13
MSWKIPHESIVISMIQSLTGIDNRRSTAMIKKKKKKSMKRMRKITARKIDSMDEKFLKFP